MTSHRRLAIAGVAAFAGAAALLPLGAADAVSWAPAASAAVHPGVMTYTNGTSLLDGGSQCTANFVFTQGATVFIGQAAHCAGTGEATETNGCSAGSLPLGTPVSVGGASKPGKLVYSSWLLMQGRGETDADTCAYNDFALVQLDPADYAKVNPSLPFWGGPKGTNTAGTALGQGVYSYGNSILRAGLTPLSPKVGISLGDAGGGWTHAVSTVSPGIPGDSGSGFLDRSGKALGVLSTISVGATGVQNNVSDLNKALAYAHAHSSFTSITLADGTEAFSGLPLL